MENKNYVEINREAWNEALLYHQKARNNTLKEGFKNPHFTTFNRTCDKYLLAYINTHLNLQGKTICQLQCNNGGELLSLSRLGASRAVGFDISDKAITEAKELNNIANQNVEFIRTNILEIKPAYFNMFDLVFISEGSLQWFPDPDDYFRMVANLLKEGGHLLIYEIHPFAYFLEQIDDFHKEITLNDLISYFEKGPYSYKSGLDYVGQINYEAKPCRWYFHKMSDIISSCIKNGIALTDMKEFNFEERDKEEINHLHKFPLSYLLYGRYNKI